MKKVSFRGSFGPLCKTVLSAACAAVALTGCAAGRVTPDPRAPAPAKDTRVLLRVCRVDGDGAHLSVGDQVELATGSRGKLTIRQLPGPENKDGLWNEGETVKVRAALLVEMVAPRANRQAARPSTSRFVPVGRFPVRLSDSTEHEQFDFLASKVTEERRNDRFPECNVDIGDDEVLVRGVGDRDRHGGVAHLNMN
jgi:hypothetical protein